MESRDTCSCLYERAGYELAKLCEKEEGTSDLIIQHHVERRKEWPKER